MRSASMTLSATTTLRTMDILGISGDRLHFYELSRRATPHLGVVVTISMADSDGTGGIC
jgi:hypothetical protein